MWQKIICEQMNIYTCLTYISYVFLCISTLKTELIENSRAKKKVQHHEFRLMPFFSSFRISTYITLGFLFDRLIVDFQEYILLEFFCRDRYIIEYFCTSTHNHLPFFSIKGSIQSIYKCLRCSSTYCMNILL